MLFYLNKIHCKKCEAPNGWVKISLTLDCSRGFIVKGCNCSSTLEMPEGGVDLSGVDLADHFYSDLDMNKVSLLRIRNFFEKSVKGMRKLCDRPWTRRF